MSKQPKPPRALTLRGTRSANGPSAVKSQCSWIFAQITFDSISHLPILLRPIEIQDAFQRAVGMMDVRIKVNKHKSHTLVTLRDTLLPKLLSGELRVAELPITTP